VRFSEAVERLEHALSRGLPGAAAHEHLAPVPRRAWPPGFHPSHVRHAAGLLLMFPSEHRAHVVLTVRAGTLGRHSGQVSLPGGVVEEGETVEHAALREAHEEIALAADEVRVLGALTPLDIPVSGFRLHPIVAAVPARPTLAPSDDEVARILEVPIEDLLDGQYLRSTQRVRDGYTLTVPAFHVCGEEIWGATAMILSEFLVLLGWSGRDTT
jgi:8-oxo-dGTP pyrophosphatase MutT (NUDIX family)